MRSESEPRRILRNNIALPAKRGGSPTVREGVKAVYKTPSLTVGLLPRLARTSFLRGALVFGLIPEHGQARFSSLISSYVRITSKPPKNACKRTCKVI